MRQPLEPRTISLETPNFLVRTMELDDIGPGWQDWLKDPVTARNLNARPESLSEETLRNYVRSFDRAKAHLLGIFEKEWGRLIGLRAIYVNPETGEFLVNVLIGESDARNKGARSQSREVMYRYFFEEMDLKSAVCTVVSTNETTLKVMDRNGWVHEGSTRKPAADGQGFVELLTFRLTREEWRRKEADKTSAA